MIQVKTIELNELSINWLIAKMRNMNPSVERSETGIRIMAGGVHWDATRNHMQGAPILDDEGVATRRMKSGKWIAMMSEDLGEEHAPAWNLYTMTNLPRNAVTSRRCRFEGKSRLMIGMLCIIYAQMGEIVEVPDELC